MRVEKEEKKRDEIFKQKLDDLTEIVKRKVAIPKDHYEKILRKVIQVELTHTQELKIYEIFKGLPLENDAAYITISRLIRCHFPDNKANLKYIVTLLTKYPVWDRIAPHIESYSPKYHEEISKAFLESQKTAEENFKGVLEIFGKCDHSDHTVEVVSAINSFISYSLPKDLKTLDWELFYNLIIAKKELFKQDDQKRLVSIYQKNVKQTNYNRIKISALLFVIDRSLTGVIEFDHITPACDLNHLFRNCKVEELKLNEVDHIAKLCAAIELNGEEEKLMWEQLPETGKEIFLVERFEIYCRTIKDKQDSKIWNLKNLANFFDFICYQAYYGKIDRKNFQTIVFCCHDQLNSEQRSAIIQANYYSYIALDYECSFVIAQCLALRKDSENNKRFTDVKINLDILATKYVKRLLDFDKWSGVLNQIVSMELPENLGVPLLEIFRQRREPTSMMRSFTSGVKSYFGEKPMNGAPTWKGEKYNTFFESMQEWISLNSDWITANLLEDKDNSKAFIERVNQLLSYLKQIKLLTSEDFKKSLEKEITLYNKVKSEEYSEWTKMFREVLKQSEFKYAFERFVNHGPSHASGIALILKQMCDFRFTGMNGVAFIVHLMRQLIPVGLQELARTQREVGFLAEFALLKYRKVLEIPLDLQHEAIEGLPEDFKIPYLHLLGQKLQNVADVSWDPHLYGNIPYKFLYLKCQNAKEEEKQVTCIRFATPTGPDGIAPEFEVFLGNTYNSNDRRFLFISLQSSVDSFEVERTKKIFRLNKKPGVFVVAFPVSGSFYKQENEFSNNSLYPTFTDFKQACIQKFIAFNKGKVEINTPGNYLIPSELLASGIFKHNLELCIDQVKEIFFPFTEVLDAADRRIFIRLFNIRFAFFLMSYTKVSMFGFLCNHSADRTGVYNALMLKLLTILFKAKDEIAFGEDSDAFTFEEMWKALVNGVPLVTAKRAMNERHDELTETLEIFDKAGVQERLLEHKGIFGITAMNFPDFKNQPVSID